MTKKNTPSTSTPRANLDGMVRNKLRQDILNGVISHNTHLSELKISQQYGVSRTPVREALCALAADGLVVMYPNRGAFSRTPSTSENIDRLDVLATLIAKAAEKACSELPETEVARLDKYVTHLPNLEAVAFGKTLKSILDIIVKYTPSQALKETVSVLENRMPMVAFEVAENTQARLDISNHFMQLVSAFKSGESQQASKALYDGLTALQQPALEVAHVGAA